MTYLLTLNIFKTPYGLQNMKTKIIIDTRRLLINKNLGVKYVVLGIGVNN